MLDIQPTLNDKQVFDFIHNGYIILESVVAEDFNAECLALPPTPDRFYTKPPFPPNRTVASGGSRGCSIVIRRGLYRTYFGAQPSL